MKDAMEAYEIAEAFADCDCNSTNHRKDYLDGWMCGTNGRVAVMMKAPAPTGSLDTGFAEKVLNVFASYEKSCAPEKWVISKDAFDELEEKYRKAVDMHNKSAQRTWEEDSIHVVCPHCGHGFVVDEDGEEWEEPKAVDEIEYRVVFKCGDGLVLVNWQYARLILKHGADVSWRFGEKRENNYTWCDACAESADGEMRFILMTVAYESHLLSQIAKDVPVVVMDRRA